MAFLNKKVLKKVQFEEVQKLDRFQKWLNNSLGNNTVECKKLATIVSGRKNVARPIFRRKQLSTSAEMQQQQRLNDNDVNEDVLSIHQYFRFLLCINI